MFNKRLFAVLLGAALVGMFVADGLAQDWHIVWEVGDGIDRNVGANPRPGVAQFWQETGSANPPPGNPANTGGVGAGRDIDDDYYTAGTYPDPIGTVAEELHVERAFVPSDNDLRFHFNLDNLDPPLHPDDLFRISVSPESLETDTDTRYGVEFLFNGTLVMPEVVVRPGDLQTLVVSPEFPAGAVGASGAAGADNVINVHGIPHNDTGGGRWMGIDHHILERLPVPEPGSLSMLLCGVFWLIPIVCWEKKTGAK